MKLISPQTKTHPLIAVLVLTGVAVVVVYFWNKWKGKGLA